MFSNSLETEIEIAMTVEPLPTVLSSDLQLTNLSIMSYELKFSPGGHYAHLKPDPKHPVYDS
jgi:hypothetical protein